MAHHRTLLLLFFFSFSLLFTTCCVSADDPHFCHPHDYKVLMQIKKSLNNPDILLQWLPATDCCQWQAVFCHPTTNRVYQLNINSGQVSGQIPPMIGDLPYLDGLILNRLSNITGPIPRSITKLKNLKILVLTQLNITGSIPGFLSELTNLEYLGLDDNLFTGSIPSSFSKFTKLGTLSLERNRLTGSIPESFGHFTGIVPIIFLSHNQLSGLIPKSLGNMDFERIQLGDNKLSGDASMLFNPNGSAAIIALFQNNLEFDFSKLRFPKTLVSLDLNSNRVYGSIPKEMSKLKKLGFLNLSYNRLCGEIPKGKLLQKFDAWSFANNKCLCGPPLAPCT